MNVLTVLKNKTMVMTVEYTHACMSYAWLLDYLSAMMLQKWMISGSTSSTVFWKVN